MSDARCDLGPVLDPGVWAKLADSEKAQVLWWCGCHGVRPDGEGWVARFKRGDRIRGPDRECVLEQTRGFLAVSPDLWPLAKEEG
jgi:hypothetical protein